MDIASRWAALHEVDDGMETIDTLPIKPLAPRAERVAEIKRQLRAGRYSPSAPEQIAEAMLSRAGDRPNEHVEREPDMNENERPCITCGAPTPVHVGRGGSGGRCKACWGKTVSESWRGSKKPDIAGVRSGRNVKYDQEKKRRAFAMVFDEGKSFTDAAAYAEIPIKKFRDLAGIERRRRGLPPLRRRNTPGPPATSHQPPATSHQPPANTGAAAAIPAGVARLVRLAASADVAEYLALPADEKLAVRVLSRAASGPR